MNPNQTPIFEIFVPCTYKHLEWVRTATEFRCTSVDKVAGRTGSESWERNETHNPAKDFETVMDGFNRRAA